MISAIYRAYARRRRCTRLFSATVTCTIRKDISRPSRNDRPIPSVASSCIRVQLGLSVKCLRSPASRVSINAAVESFLTGISGHEAYAPHWTEMPGE